MRKNSEAMLNSFPNVISPFAKQLIGLANPNFDCIERGILGQVIDYLILQLDAGHSCAKLNIMVRDLTLEHITIQENETEQIVWVTNLLIKSNLVAKLSISNADETPFTQQQNTSFINNIENKPLHLVVTSDGKHLVYITRYLHYELQIKQYLSKLINPIYIADTAIAEADNYLSQLSTLHGLPNEQQRLAILNSLAQQFSIITGGPGTGKTTTVILILSILFQCYGKSLRVKICAPTGKATARVKESLQNSLTIFSQYGINNWQPTFDELLNNSSNFGTIHKLLGYIPNQIYFRHNENNPLDAEVLIIDESSMVGLPLFSKLITAINPNTTKHIILLGDKNQLSSVEEGYVFASLVNHFTNINSSIVVELTESKRNTGAVGQFAKQILDQRIDLAFNTLSTNENTQLVPCELKPLLYQACYGTDGFNYTNYIQFIQANIEHKVFSNTYIKQLFSQYAKFALLCLSNKGVFGTYNLNVQIERQIKLQLETKDNWYAGRPIIIIENDATLGLYNGDIGICQQLNNKLVVLFNNGKIYIPEVLPPYKLAFAITIHKSQGSEFDNVAIVLKPDNNNDILKDNFLVKELVYTAVTRARSKIIIYSGQRQVKKALSQQTSRHSGLEYFLSS